MKGLDAFLHRDVHRELVEEYHALDNSEDRLSWLMERAFLHTPLSADALTADRKVPGCLSGLWLHGEYRDGVCSFGGHSDSDMVQGIASFICDLYSHRSPEEVIEIGDDFVTILGLERLLSTTRRRAVSSTLSFILSIARGHCVTAVNE